jgi:hypothetical protein
VVGGSGSEGRWTESESLVEGGCVGASSAGGGGGGRGDPRPRPAPEKDEKGGMVGEGGIAGSPLPRPRPAEDAAEKRSGPLSSSGMGRPGARGGAVADGGRPRPRPRPAPLPPMPEKDEKAAA